MPKSVLHLEMSGYPVRTMRQKYCIFILTRTPFQVQKVRGQLAGGGGILWRPPAQLVYFTVLLSSSVSIFWYIVKTLKYST